MVSNLMFDAQSTSTVVIIRAKFRTDVWHLLIMLHRETPLPLSGKSAFPFLLTGASDSFGPIARINMY